MNNQSAFSLLELINCELILKTNNLLLVYSTGVVIEERHALKWIVFYSLVTEITSRKSKEAFE